MKDKIRDFEDNFQKWYFKNHCKSNMKYDDLLPHHHWDIFGWFYDQDISFKWGIYEDFFENFGIYPQVQDCYGHEVFKIDKVDRYHATCCVRGGKYYALSFSNDKKESRQDAINKSIELYEQLEVLNFLSD